MLAAAKVVTMAYAKAALLVDMTAARWVEWWVVLLAEKRVGERADWWAVMTVDVWVEQRVEETGVLKEKTMEWRRVLHLAGLSVASLVHLLVSAQAVSRVLQTAEKKAVQLVIRLAGMWDVKMWDEPSVDLFRL